MPPDTIPPPDVAALLAHAKPYRPTTVVSARRLIEDSDWQTDRGATLRAAAGDWELTDAVGNSWTVSPEAFARSYRRRSDGRWAEHEHVDAVRLTRSLQGPTRESTSPAEAGETWGRPARVPSGPRRAP